MNVCVITYSNSRAFIVPLRNLSSVLQERGKLRLIVPEGNITGDVVNVPDTNFFKITNNGSSNVLVRIFNRLNMVVITALEIIRLRNDIDAYIFFMEGSVLLPAVILKLMRKRTIILLPSNIIYYLSNSFLNNVRKFFSKMSLIIVDDLIVYSPNLIVQWNLEVYRHKILIAGEHFLDLATFTVTIPYTERPPIIGYIGRLSAEKGVQHFTHALPAILGDHKDFRIFIGGDGQLKDNIESSIHGSDLTDRVDLPGWIAHEDLPGCLNQLRLLVLPSYTEGLPNILLEAMASGTPVLATPVGAIPDVITDGETGFIMENNTPECIAENVARALVCPELKEIAEAGRRYVEEEYRFEKVVERWEGILSRYGSHE